jgi:hypothetical protein
LQDHDDYDGLRRAHGAILDLNQFLNEVKRDSEDLQGVHDILVSQVAVLPNALLFFGFRFLPSVCLERARLFCSQLSIEGENIAALGGTSDPKKFGRHVKEGELKVLFHDNPPKKSR